MKPINLSSKPLINDSLVIKKINEPMINDSRRVEEIANYLLSKFNSKDSWAFYCKVAKKLPQAQVASIAEWSLRKARETGGCAGCLFNVVSRKAMGEL